jgi:tRNA threonylcarbamoyladenosine biosynthesis protein TsaE
MVQQLWNIYNRATMEFKFVCKTAKDTQALAAALGKAVKGGEVLAFHSDLGGGKTTFVKGFAKGMGVTDLVQSPTFTISQLHHAGRGLELHHFDFYRLAEQGVMRGALAESETQSNVVVAIEWGDIMHDILPPDAIHLTLAIQEDDSRVVTINIPKKSDHLIKTLQDYQQNRTVA